MIPSVSKGSGGLGWLAFILVCLAFALYLLEPREPAESIAIGQGAARNAVTLEHSIIIGRDACDNLVRGTFIICIGDGAEAPTPEAHHLLIIAGFPPIPLDPQKFGAREFDAVSDALIKTFKQWNSQPDSEAGWGAP
ncbi:MAG: hypothetical protein AB7H90_01195 [Alphaproteobacteria bacterium]